MDAAAGRRGAEAPGEDPGRAAGGPEQKPAPHVVDEAMAVVRDVSYSGVFVIVGGYGVVSGRPRKANQRDR